MSLTPIPLPHRLQLLNSTIQSIALSVNKVLTATYHAVYDDAKEGDELTLLTAPLCSTAELQSLFEGGVIDIESALPAALHSLGCTAVEIAGAVKRRRQADQDGTDTKLLEAQNSAKLGDADVLLKAAQTNKTTAETEVVKQNVAKTKAETKKLNHDAAARPARLAREAAVAAAAVAARPRLPKSELNKNFATCVWVWVYTKNRSRKRQIHTTKAVLVRGLCQNARRG